MRIILLLIIFFIPFTIFSESVFTVGFLEKHITLLENKDDGCIALGWSKAGILVFASTVEPDSPVGGYHVDIVVFNCVYDFQVAAFRVKNPGENKFDLIVTEKAVNFLNESKIIPEYRQLQKFPLEYKNDSYLITEYSLRERIKTNRNLKLEAKKSGACKSLDVSSLPEKVVGFFQSPYENRIAICWFVPPMGGPAGDNIGGGYYSVSGCHMDTGFETPAVQ